MSLCLILFGGGLVRESKLKRHELPGNVQTRASVDKMDKWRTYTEMSSNESGGR